MRKVLKCNSANEKQCARNVQYESNKNLQTNGVSEVVGEEVEQIISNSDTSLGVITNT